jgi:hypothetical protein
MFVANLFFTAVRKAEIVFGRWSLNSSNSGASESMKMRPENGSHVKRWLG